MSIENLLLQLCLHLEVRYFSVALHLVVLRILVLQLELIAVLFLLLAFKQVRSSILTVLDPIRRITTLTLAIIDLCLVLLHQVDRRCLLLLLPTLTIGLLDELLMLLLQILFETLECRVYNLLVLAVRHVILLTKLIKPVLLINLPFLKEIIRILVQVWSWTFLLIIRIADSG